MKLVRYNPYPDYLAACHGQDVGLLLHFLHSHLYMYQHQMEHSRDDAGTCHEQRGVTLRLTHSASLGLADSFLISLRNLSRVTECRLTGPLGKPRPVPPLGKPRPIRTSSDVVYGIYRGLPSAGTSSDVVYGICRGLPSVTGHESVEALRSRS